MSKDKILVSKYKIGILAGGDSNERQVSLKSGKAVFEALKKDNIDVTFIDVNSLRFEEQIRSSGVNAVFIALHGRFGEDGQVQSILERMKIPYTGSGPEASRIAMDKAATKDELLKNGLRVPDFRIARTVDDIDDYDIWYPCVVKPKCEGSSVGLSVVLSECDISSAVNDALRFDDEVLIERFIPGREITVGIIDGKALPVIEIRPSNGVYDFDAKYQADDTAYIIPANIDDYTYKKLQEQGIRAHEALGCGGVSRVDMRLSDDGGIYVLEVNTIPGLTERSLLPMAARESGLEFHELCIKILSMALSEFEHSSR